MRVVEDGDGSLVRYPSRVDPGTLGVTLDSPRLEAAFSALAMPLATGSDKLAGRLPAGLGGQFALGALLGVVWMPCTGPTLAAAVTLAAQNESLRRAATVMLGFGVGAVVPVLALAYGSRRALLGHRARLATLAAVGRPLIAVVSSSWVRPRSRAVTRSTRRGWSSTCRSGCST